MGKKARQILSALAFTATVGSGAALADASVVTNSTASTTVSNEVESSIVSNSSTISSSSNEQKSIDSSPLQGESATHEDFQISQKQFDEEQSTTQENKSEASSASTQNEGVVNLSKASVSSSSTAQSKGKLSPLWYSDANPESRLDAKSFVSQTPATSSTNSNPPHKSDPFSGIIDELGFLSEITLPLALGGGFGGFASDKNYPSLVLIFIPLILALIASRMYIFSRYTDRLRYSGFIHAPRSDTLWAFDFATPPRWVLSTALSRA